MTLPMALKKLVRPLVPDRVMARFRLHEHSRQVRTNVDVVIEDAKAARRWLRTTPDTYRVRPRGSFVGPDVAPDDVIVVSETELTDAQRADLLLPLRDDALGASVMAAVEPPGLVARRRTEPTVAPFAIGVRREVHDEVGGAPEVGALPALLARIRDAGHAYALLPDGPAGSWATRTDPVGGAALVVLALVPMHDVGGGSRGSQLAQEFVKQGWHVAYVAQYGTAESVDLGLRYVHPSLEQYRQDEFDVDAWTARLGDDERVVLIEAPTAEHVRLGRALQQRGHRVIYDLIDDWSAASLGGEWYRQEAERELVGLADTLAASAQDLVVRLERLSGRDVLLVPNAVNVDLFGGDPGPLPDDFPPGEGLVLGYHGSLYGDWFDWAALRDVAAAYPDARVVVIGDEPDDHPVMPGNVSFLGLKAQIDLPAYVARFDVGLLPFTVTEVTHAVSPLKVYEYLAAGVPVAAPPLRSLSGIAGVVRHDALAGAVAVAQSHGSPRFASAHAWSERVASLGGQRSHRVPVDVVRRRVVHREPPDRELLP